MWLHYSTIRVLSVRTEALNTLVPIYNQLDDNTRQRFGAVLNEYLGIQQNQGDRPESYLNQGSSWQLPAGFPKRNRLTCSV